MTYLLDSDILIYFFNLTEPGHGIVSQLLKQKEKVVVSVLSVIEARSGWSNEDAQKFLPILYSLFDIDGLTNVIAERAGTLRYEYKQKGRKLKTVDVTIAATALEHSYCLITNNREDYPIPELNMFDLLP